MESAHLSTRYFSKFQAFLMSKVRSPRQKIWEENCVVLSDPKFTRKYQLFDEIIGEGSFGTVITAECRTTHEKRAIKAIRRIEKVAMLTIELDLLTELGGHFNIVQLHDFFYTNGSVALVLEYFPHCTASELLMYSKRDLSFALLYFRNLLTAVAYLHHNGYVHRDIKLSNFLFSSKTNSFRLVDFGLATNDRSNIECPRNIAVAAMEKDKECTACRRTSSPCMFCKGRPKRETYHVVGTPGVRAPELLFGLGLFNPSIDIFSCGIVLLSLVCAKHPFFMPKDETENIMDLAFLLGSETIETMAKLEGMRVTISERLPPADYYHLILCLRFGFDHVRLHCSSRQSCESCRRRSYNNLKGVCFCRKDYETEKFSTGKNESDLMTIYVDLIYHALEPDRFKRYNADQLLQLIESYENRVNFKPKPLTNRDEF
uniref:non-specific serine/threonine protein kinase n=4 Tax=Caenorhabditis japonica TaxID=281687 RepID=A0A8R1E2N1_CAEJA